MWQENTQVDKALVVGEGVAVQAWSCTYTPAAFLARC